MTTFVNALIQFIWTLIAAMIAFVFFWCCWQAGASWSWSERTEREMWRESHKARMDKIQLPPADETLDAPLSEKVPKFAVSVTADSRYQIWFKAWNQDEYQPVADPLDDPYQAWLAVESSRIHYEEMAELYQPLLDGLKKVREL